MEARQSAEPREAVAYAELLKLAHDEGLKSVSTALVLTPCEENGRLCIVKAAVETDRGHFEGLGDADPGNTEADFAPHLIRVAETRAKARALRDAVNVGVVSLEELDGVSSGRTSNPGPGARIQPPRIPMRPNGAYQRAGGNGSFEPMSEGQRRYLFRLMSGQGYLKERAEERLKELFQVSTLSQVSKRAATEMIDQLLATSAPGNGGGNGTASRSLR